MPYLPSQARLKSDTYRNILDADITEQQERVIDLLAKQQLSGSIDANNPTRDEDGFLVSIEDPNNPGQAADGITESVRVENKQQFFNDRYLNNIPQEFTHFVVPEVGDQDDDALVEEITEIQVQADTSKTPDPYRTIIVEFINRLLDKNSLKTIMIAAKAGFVSKGNSAGIEMIDDGISAEKLNSLIVKLIRVFPPGQKRVRRAISLLKAMRKLKTYQIDLKIALDLRNYAVILQDFIFKNKTLRRTYREFGLPVEIQTQTGGTFNLTTTETKSVSNEASNDDEEELRGKGYIV
jgi:hypothetical protein